MSLVYCIALHFDRVYFDPSMLYSTELGTLNMHVKRDKGLDGHVMLVYDQDSRLCVLPFTLCACLLSRFLQIRDPKLKKDKDNLFFAVYIPVR